MFMQKTLKVSVKVTEAAGVKGFVEVQKNPQNVRFITWWTV